MVINTAGLWAARFAAEAGCPIIIGPGRSQLLVTERLRRPFIKSWVTISGLGYMRPTHSNNLVIGSAGARNDQFLCHVDYPTAAVQVRRLCNLLPWLKDISIIRAFQELLNTLPIANPISGPYRSFRPIRRDGFAGEGFCPGRLTGKILAEMICGIEPSVSLKPFRPDRFATALNGGNTHPDVSYPLDKLLVAWKAVENYNPELNN